MRICIVHPITLAAAPALSGCDSDRDAQLARLQSPRPEERAAALHALAVRPRAENTSLFTAAARDPVAIVRAEAALALGTSEDERVVDLLGEMLGDGAEEVQAAAARGLAHIRTSREKDRDKARAYLVSQYPRRGRTTRLSIVQALQEANVPGAMASAVAAEARHLWERNLAALTSGTPAERVAAAEAIGKSGRPEALNRLAPLLKDPQVLVAAAAARGLGEAGDPRAVPLLTEQLSGSHPELRASVITALARLKDPGAVPHLRQVSLERSSASTDATDALVALPRDATTDGALCAVLLEGQPRDSLVAGRALRRRGGCPQSVLQERWGQEGGRAPVLRALSILGPAAGDWSAQLLPLIASGDPQLRVFAIDAAGKLKLPSTTAALQKAWEAELHAVELAREDWVKSPPTEGGAASEADRTRDLFARVAALNAQKLKDMGRRGTRRLPPAELGEDLGTEEARAAAALLEALGRVGAPGARELLELWTQDPLPVLRRAAYVGLASLGGDAVASAREGLFDPDRDVQQDTARALVRAGEAGQVQVVQAAVELAGDRISLLAALLDADQSLPPAAVAQVLGLLAEGGPDAALAARLLGEARAAEAVKPLLKYLDDPAAMGRREALVALGRMGDVSVAGAVARDLCHESPELRATALEVFTALAQANDGKGKGDLAPHAPAIDALKGDYHARVRELAAAAEKALQ